MDGAELVIYSAAIKPDNPERVLAREKGIPELERSVALGQISERYREVVAVAGCHGKTTITSMLAIINDLAKTDATIHVGGFVEFLGGGVRVGSQDLFVTEACEYVESFLTLKPTIALINNIDDDHLDYYKDIDAIVVAFEKFLALLPEGGVFVACADDARVMKLTEQSDLNVVTYGLTGGDYTASNIEFDALGNAGFTVLRHGEPLGRVQLSVPGMHNVVNALGSIAVADRLKVPFSVSAKALNQFHNTKRRFEYYGERNGVKVFHDYGHHPNEIRATLDAAKRVPHNRLICVFQCNSYTRARTLFCENVVPALRTRTWCSCRISTPGAKRTPASSTRGIWWPPSTAKATTPSIFQRSRRFDCIWTSTPRKATSLSPSAPGTCISQTRKLL